MKPPYAHCLWLALLITSFWMTLPAAAQDTATEPEKLTENRKVYLSGLQKIEQEYRRRLRELAEAHVKALEEVKAYYTKKGDFENTWAVKQEIERLQKLLAKGDDGVQEIINGLPK